MTTDADPYEALRRVLDLRPNVRRSLLVLQVWCETSKCTPVRVYRVHDGLLVQCRSDADVRAMREDHPHLSDWSRRRAFFLDWWLSSEDGARQPLQVVCDCAQTTPRLVDLRMLADLVPDRGARAVNAALASLAPHAP